MKIIRQISILFFCMFFLFLSSNFVQSKISDIKLVFTTGEGDGNFEVYLLESLKDKPINLTNHPAKDGAPSFSPDGERIAFVSDRDGNWEIYIIDIETKNLERLTHNPEIDDYPAWSPDGEKIAFLSIRNGIGGLYIMNLLNRKIIRLTNDKGAGSPIAWFSDGKKIAFTLVSNGGEYSIYGVDSSRAEPAKSLEDFEILIEHPPPDTSNFWGGLSCSPDGKRMVFASQRKFAGGHTDIYIIDLLTGNFKNLTDSNLDYDMYPCWTPDGNFIAFSSDRNGSIGGSDIYFMTPEGKIIEQLKLEGDNVDPEIFDPDFYSVSPLDNSKACTWGEIKR